MRKTKASIYDFPTYYDLVFGSDTAAELRFLSECFKKFVGGRLRRAFEPACGTGRLMYRMAQTGVEVCGNDLNEKAVDYCNQRMERLNLKGRADVADMSDFEVKKPFDFAFNTINSFRHLQSEVAAVGHLECMARALKPGGIYVLGLHLTPTRGEPTDEESWSARRGQLAINTYMWPVEKLPKKRLERFGIRFDVYKPTDSFRIEDVLELRSYTVKQFEKLVAAATSMELVEIYDFGYEIDKPIKLDAETEDILAILRAK
ncbi:MAG: class I SAM-dependent methyltransferase [Aureliella sp.]